jgi:hypothetical protein
LTRPPLARVASHAPLLLTAALLASCGDGDRVEISESRPRHAGERPPALDVPIADSLPAPDGYRWKLPQGWTEQPPNQFRRTNFSFGPNAEGECYLSLVQGSETDNINRWRNQMSLPPLSEEEVAALPRKDLFERPAAFIDLTGTYTGMSDSSPRENWRLAGVIRAQADVTLTVKMTGPADLVGRELANFDAFLASLRLTVDYPR